jgi:hypothetical protein
MTSAIEILEEHFGELELLVCAWPECEVGAWEQDADGVRWCETHIDPENLHPLWVDPTHTGHGACARCGELVVTQAVNEPGTFLHRRCVRSWALAKLPQFRARGAYGRRRG